MTHSHTHNVGNSSLAQAVAALAALGCGIYLPMGDGYRCDLIADIPGKGPLRVQVKTGRVASGALKFSGFSVGYRNNESLTYENDVDMFVIACPDNGRVYAIPIAEVRPSRSHLRLEPSLNNQELRIRWASEYDLANGLPKWLFA